MYFGNWQSWEEQALPGSTECCRDSEPRYMWGLEGVRGRLEGAWNLEVPQPAWCIAGEQRAAQQAGSEVRARVSGQQGAAMQSAALPGPRAVRLLGFCGARCCTSPSHAIRDDLDGY